VNAEYRFADGLGLCADVEQLCDRPCSFLPSARKLPARPPAASASELPYKLAFLGRWHPNKGADLLMQALQLLDDVDWEKIEEVRFFGGGPLEGQIQASAEALSAAGRPVTVGGYLDKSEAADLIAWGDYLLLPSRIESIPVIFSDAMQVGTPLVATPVGDLPRLFERYGAGVLATDATPAAFAEAIREALAHDVAHFDARLQSAGQEFDLTTIVAQFLNGIGAA
jgi:glycosyltransferase involved in cell wall biosynthesis